VGETRGEGAGEGKMRKELEWEQFDFGGGGLVCRRLKGRKESLKRLREGEGDDG